MRQTPRCMDVLVFGVLQPALHRAKHPFDLAGRPPPPSLVSVPSEAASPGGSSATSDQVQALAVVDTSDKRIARLQFLLVGFGGVKRWADYAMQGSTRFTQR